VFETVLIANRGEIAVRIARTLRAMGIRVAAVHSDADAGARHVREADVAVRLGPASAAESYLHVERTIDAALRVGARALHPGYGFLAENPALALACEEAGITFIGPPASAIEAMGDKIRAKATAAAAGVPVVPGRSEPGMDDDALVDAAHEVGFPVLLKPSAGGGGKGMRLVGDPGDLAAAITGARREAQGAFGDDTLLVERFITRPRHLEVQVLADAHGAIVHLGERECSLQRRHQKIVEEAPAPGIDPDLRDDLGRRAIAVARACGYVNAGTVELIASDDAPDEPFFMEMNTRLQVEHPVTEAVWGVDLVELQVRVAAGEPLPFTQDQLAPRGHAVEARVYAEDPARGFLPTGGTVTGLLDPAGPGVRVDSGLAPGTEVGSHYDPLLAKVVASGDDRDQALARLDRALAGTAVLGVTTNVAFLRRLLGHPEVAAGRLHTGLVEDHLGELAGDDPDVIPGWVTAAAAALDRAAGGPVRDRWDLADGWRVGGSDTADGERVDVAWVAPEPSGADGPTEVAVTVDGVVHRCHTARSARTRWVAHAGEVWAITDPEPTPPGGGPGAAAGGEVRSPMPGTVVGVAVTDGAQVEAGTTLVVVEAMKMEHALAAPVAGSVELRVAPGQRVALDEVLAVVVPPTEPGEDP
jgi:acetyl-CoA/propionyl-CoA carboxylase, biotin carboxylase, biotin carboxyl carrier protein